MRARVFLRQGDAYRLAVEMDVDDVDEAWRRIEADPQEAGRRLRPRDIVYVGDQYLELDGDGGWHSIRPSDLTRDLYRQVLDD